MRIAPFGSKRCRGFLPRKHEHDDSLQAASMYSAKKPFPLRVLQSEDINRQRLPQFWRICQRDSLYMLSVTGFETRITLQLINHVLHPDRTTATLKQQAQARLRNVTSGNVETMNRLPNTLTFSWGNIIFGFLSRRCNKNCRRGGQQTVSFRQGNVKLRGTEIATGYSLLFFFCVRFHTCS